MKASDSVKFIKESRHWLIKWIENGESIDAYGGMSIFRDHFFSKAEKPVEEFWEDLKTEHENKILLHCVFSVGRESSAFNPETISGFFEKKGRLPKESDKVRCIFARTRKMVRITKQYCVPGYVTFENDWQHDILTELKLEIDENQNKTQ